jgi:hypothetical protein
MHRSQVVVGANGQWGGKWVHEVQKGPKRHIIALLGPYLGLIWSPAFSHHHL